MFSKYLFFVLVFLALSFNSRSQIPTTDLILWYNGDSVEIIAGKVSKWWDLSGNNNDAIQNNNANRPTLTSSTTLNNQNVLFFDGTDDALATANPILTPPLTTTVFMVFNTQGSAQADILNQFQGSGSGRQLWGVNATTVLGFGTLTYNFTRDDVSMLTLVNSNLSNGHTSRLNGVPRHVGTLTNIQQVPMMIGARNIAGSLSFNGEIAELLIYNSTLSSTEVGNIENLLMDKYSFALDLGADTTISYGFCPLDLSVHPTFTDVLWSTSDTSKTITINQSGSYYVTATDIFGRTKSDTISVNFPTLDLNDSIVCAGDSLIYSLNLGQNYSYLWSDFSTADSIVVKNGGNYNVQVTDTNSCTLIDTFVVQVDSFALFASLGNDTTLCAGNNIALVTGAAQAVDYLWQPGGEMSSSIQIDTSGTYSLNFSNSNACSLTDTIVVTVLGVAPTPFLSVGQTCLNDTTTFTNLSFPSASIASTQWIVNNLDTFNTTDLSYKFSNIGNQNIAMTVNSFSGCSKDTVFDVSILDTAIVLFSTSPICISTSSVFPNLSIAPLGDTITSFSWFINNSLVSNDTDLDYSFSLAGSYEVGLSVNLSNGCVSNYSQNVLVQSSFPPPNTSSLVKPANNIVLQAQNIDFLWSNDANASSYRLKVYSDSNLQTALIDTSGLITNQVTLDMPNNTDTLFWQVISYNPCGDSAISLVENFIVFDFSSLPNPALWMNGDSVQEISGGIATWYDISGNNNNASQSNSLNRPVLSSSATLNHQNVLLYDGINDALATSTAVLTPPLNSSIFMVFNSTDSSQADLFNQYQTTAGFGQIWGLNSAGGTNVFAFGALSYNFPHFGPGLFSLRNDNLPNTHNTYMNGVLKHTGTLSNIQQVPLLIGARNINGSLSFDGEIAELIIFNNTLNTQDYVLVETYLMDKYAPPVYLGEDIVQSYSLCPVTLDGSSRFKSFLWSTGDTTSTISVEQPGSYWVQALDIFDRWSTDTINVFIPNPIEEPNPVFCINDSLEWASNLISSDYSYSWSTGANTSSIYISDEESYYLTITDTSGCQYFSDTIFTAIDSFKLEPLLGVDTSLCAGNNFNIVNTGNFFIESYLWSTNDTTNNIQIQSPGLYWLEAINENGCISRDSINITILGVAPTALFSVDTLCRTQQATFMDQSTTSGAIVNSWSWDFGNSDQSVLPNPTTSFPSSGSYLVNFQIGTTDGCFGDTSILVDVKEIPNANYSFGVFCAGSDGVLVDESVSNSPNPINSWFWDFGGGQTSNAQAPNFTLNVQGNYPISLYVVNEFGCSDSITKLVEVFPPLLPNFNTDKICIGDTTVFTDNTPSFSIINRTWDFDFNNQSSSQENPLFYYPNPGSYNVNLSVTNAIGCQSEITKLVEIRELPSASVLFDNTCVGGESLLYDISTTDSGFIANQTWEIEGDLFSGDSISYVFDEIGDYPIGLSIIDNFNCANDTAFTLSVFPLPEVDFSFSPNYGTAPIDIQFTNESSANAIDFLWDFGNGSSNSIEENPLFNYGQNGVYEITLVASTQEACADSATQSISIIPTDLDIELSDFSIQKVSSPNGSLAYKPSVLLKNVGTRVIFNADLLLSINKETQIAETWEGVLPVGQAILYELTSFAVIENESAVDYVCLEAQNVNDNTEENFTNNKICLVQNGSLQTSELYPIPTTNMVYLDMIMEKEGTAQLAVFDLLGKSIIPARDLILEKGYNQVSINTSFLQAGKYIVNILYQGELIPFSLLIQNP